jgi:CBS domain-containing protein
LDAEAMDRSSDQDRTKTGPLPLTEVVHAPLLNPLGERVGRVEDLVVRLADAGAYPTVTGLKARVGGRDLFVGSRLLAGLGPEGARLREQTLNLARFERRPGEVLLAGDVLDRALINVAAGRLVHANDLLLAPVGERWLLVGVDPGPRGALRRLLPRRLRRADPDRRRPVIDWKDIQPFVGHVPTARLLIPPQRLLRLHPAQIADLVEAASREQGEEIIGAVHGDPELSADVFEELDTHHQLELLRSRSDEDAAALLARMAPDDAVDLLGELDQDRRLPVLTLVPAPQQEKLQALLQHHPATAGGLMSPDFVAVPRGSTVAQALERVRSDATTPHQLLGNVFVTEPDGRLVGGVDTVDLVRGPPEAAIEDLEGLIDARVRVDSDLQDVALLMADFNLTAVAVVESEGRVVGAISVDDMMETLIPADWRTRADADPSA